MSDQVQPGDIAHTCPVSVQNILKGRDKGNYQYRDINVISNCPWCGWNLHYQKYFTTGFLDHMKKLGYSEKQIRKAFSVAVTLINEPKQNKMAEKGLVQIATKDLLEKNFSYAIDEFLLEGN